MRKNIVFNGSSYECCYLIGESSESKPYENHCHTNYEIIVILNGKVTYISESSREKAMPGDIIIIPPLKYHSIQQKPSREYERLTLTVDDENIFKAVKEHLTGFSDSKIVKAEPPILSVTERLREYLPKSEGDYAPLVDALICELLFLIADGRYNCEKTASTTDGKLSQIIDYINQNITSKLTIEAISENVFLSPSTISHLFKKEMNISIKQYVLQKKLAYASKLMQSGYSAYEASKMIGYNNYSNFYTAYKKILGKIPSNN